MSETFEISIPADIEGFILLQCPLCGEFFKVRVDDYAAEDVLEIWCPSCGLKGDNYLTEDVIELALKKVKNYGNDMIFDEMKKWEKQFQGGFVSFEAGKKPTKEEETPIKLGIEALEIVEYPCCKRVVKVKAIYKICGSYCPFCGVRYDEY